MTVDELAKKEQKLSRLLHIFVGLLVLLGLLLVVFLITAISGELPPVPISAIVSACTHGSVVPV